MWYCNNCGSPNLQNEKYCLSCGKPFQNFSENINTEVIPEEYETLNSLLETLNPHLIEKGPIKINEWYVGRFKIEEILGIGHTSIVFKAIDTYLERTIVLKVWYNSDKGGIKNSILSKEGKLLANLEHPNIVKIFDIGVDEHSGFPWIAEEYLGNTTVREFINKRNASVNNWQDFINVAIQISNIIDYMHNSRMFQLDIKPDNLSLDIKDKKIKLMDLGSTAKLDEPFDRLGTPGYIAPELIASKKITEQSDIFSFGALLYELITGNNPFKSIQYEFFPNYDFKTNPYISVSIISRDWDTRLLPPVEWDAIDDIGVSSREQNSKKYYLLEKMEAFNPKNELLNCSTPKNLIELINSMLSYHPNLRPSAHDVRVSLISMMENKSKQKVLSLFISHSHLDKERFVINFANKLKKKGFEVWLDEWNLKIGEPFWETISQAIQDMDFIIVILSKNSLDSKGVMEEIRTAHLLNLDKVKILPLRIDPISFSDIPIFLRSRHVLDFVGWENNKKFEDGVSKLVSDIIALADFQ